MADRRTALSKFVSYALRHRPWEFELELDADGWVPVEQLVEALRHERGWESLRAEDLVAMIAAAPRPRHEMRDDLIRARYGHSVPRRIQHEAESPPELLFHGTARNALPGIALYGLLPRRRQYVHLARRPDLALQIGRRHDTGAVVLEIDGVTASAGGVQFYRAGEEIVLARQIPPEFIRNLGLIC